MEYENRELTEQNDPLATYECDGQLDFSDWFGTSDTVEEDKCTIQTNTASHHG